MARILTIPRDLSTARSVMVSPDSLNAVSCQTTHGPIGYGRLVVGDCSRGKLDCLKWETLWPTMKTGSYLSFLQAVQMEIARQQHQTLLLTREMMRIQEELANQKETLQRMMNALQKAVLTYASKTLCIHSTNQPSSQTSRGLTNSQDLKSGKPKVAYTHFTMSNIAAVLLTTVACNTVSLRSTTSSPSKNTTSERTIANIIAPTVELGLRRYGRWRGMCWSSIVRDESARVRSPGCPYATKGFTRQESLQKHLRRKH